jgi:CBS domain-containing protein
MDSIPSWKGESSGTARSIAMTAREIMHKPVLVAAPEALVRDIAAQLGEHKFSGMPVTEPDGKVVGVITEEDIMRSLMEQKDLETLTVQEIMSKDLLTVPAGASVVQVMQVLHDQAIGRVPVTVSGKVVGIISRADVIRALLHVKSVSSTQETAPASRRPRVPDSMRKRQPKKISVMGSR